jgi:hypothetical protein
MKRKRKAFRTKAEREAWDAHVDETLRRLRDVAEKALADLKAREKREATS